MNNNKNYKSLGQMLKAGDFEALIKDLEELKASGDIKQLISKTSENPISELDELLFFTPQYMTDGKVVKDRALEFIDLALELGANPNAYMKNGENTVLKLCELETVEPLKHLIENNKIVVDLTHTDGMGNDCMFYAVMANSPTLIEYLNKEHSFDVNKKNFLSNDQTYLHYACGHGKEDSIEKLVELGGDLTIKDHYGHQAVDMIIIAYDEETREEYADEPETIEKWDKLYDKIKSLTKKQDEKKPRKLKKSFP